MRRDFHIKYPSADIADYQFEVLLNDDLTVQSRKIYHQDKKDKNAFMDISKPAFDPDTLYWKKEKLDL